MSWELKAEHLADLARGATLLGTGGGGDPYIGRMLVERVLGDGSITILDPDEVADDLFVIPTAQMGAPTVMVEKIPAGTEPTAALRALEEHLGRSAQATMPIECGGINSMIPLIVAPVGGRYGDAETEIPVERTYATMRSVEFDSIILADGVEPVTEIALLISESWRHLKAIAAYGDACTLLDNCDFQRTDPGICFGSELGDVVDFIAEALAEHRVWSRTDV